MESYGKMLSRSVNDVLDKYLDDISNKYNIDRIELKNMWDKIEVESKPKVCNDKLISEMNSKKKNELVELCKEMELDTKGNKKDLVARIVKEKTKPNNIMKKIKSSINSIIIKKNKWDNYEHTPTRFVFNPNNKTVIGKQENDGNVIQLNKDDITICNQYKFKYNLPTNLGNTTYDDSDDDFNATTDESDLSGESGDDEEDDD